MTTWKQLLSGIFTLLMAFALTGCDTGQTPPQAEKPSADTAISTSAATEPTGSTVPAESTEVQVPPETTQPAGTTPPATKPPETVPPEVHPTEPISSAPQRPNTEATQHNHSYQTRTVEPNCITAGYTIFACDCGDSYTGEVSVALGHNYVDTVIPPTFWKQGYTMHKCGRCQDEIVDSYCNMTSEDKAAFIVEVQNATIKYINQFRVEAGSTEANVLPRLTAVAEYRAVLLHSDFSHSTKVLRQVLAKYEYGEFITPDGWDPSEYYYYFPGQEAISRTSKTGTADEIGKQFALNFRNSAGHWRYVGDVKYDYLAVGIAYDPSAPAGCYWTCCVYVATTDQYG